MEEETENHKKDIFSSSDSSGDECSQNVKKTLFSKDQYCYPARAPSPPMSQSQRDSTFPQLFATPLSSVISSPANSSIERTTVTQSGLNVVANRIAKLELEIVKLKEYLENILPQIAGLNKQQPSTETLTTTSIPPLPCNEKEEVENLEVWLESKQNQNLLVQYLGRVGGKTVDYVVRKTLAQLFSNKLAQSYNWTGKNGKNALLQLKIKDIIFRVVRNNKQTESGSEFDIIEKAKSWFRFAKDRDGGREERRKSKAN
ncbi:uncharacterized protein LOC120354481 [Nilaparvata lugens]|uniref:uncharacterized protein LOC120354481 n=1 Tax=Nilaparvata lugens TaxID=108931 RepID=UPI00193CA57D|nr:uncharacterized protein LOC120354481 [Nilaparvata lugens]XP_039297661.1 uncharacterized protein LOC120354481 [Nilaparvata lugens]